MRAHDDVDNELSSVDEADVLIFVQASIQLFRDLGACVLVGN